MRIRIQSPPARDHRESNSLRMAETKAKTSRTERDANYHLRLCVDQLTKTWRGVGGGGGEW
jgi:hypothetical protein